MILLVVSYEVIIIPGEILEFLYINITGLCTTYRWTYCTYCTHCNAIEMVELRIGPDTFLGNIPSDGIFHLTPESGMSTNFLFCWNVTNRWFESHGFMEF